MELSEKELFAIEILVEILVERFHSKIDANPKQIKQKVIITTEAVVAELPQEKESAMPAGAGAGMDY